jgi:hypothetical protein
VSATVATPHGLDLQALLDDIGERASLLAFEREGHRYTRLVDGAPVVSVTGVINGSGYMDKRFMADRTERGEIAHRATELHEEQLLDLDAIPDEHRGYVESYVAWFDEIRPTTILREMMVYDPTLDVCGTLDRFWILGGALEITDFKAGVSQPWHGVQTAGYRRLLLGAQFAHYANVIHRSTLLLKKNGKPAKRIPHPLQDASDRDDQNAFFNALGTHHWRTRYVSL